MVEIILKMENSRGGWVTVMVSDFDNNWFIDHRGNAYKKSDFRKINNNEYIQKP